MKQIVLKKTLLLLTIAGGVFTMNSQSFTFDSDVENYIGRTGGTTITHEADIEGRAVIQWNHMDNSQPTFESTNTIDATSNKFVRVVFQNNSNANNLRLRHDSGTPWEGSVGNIIANSTDWQTIVIELSNLNAGYTGNVAHTMYYQFRDGSTALSGNIYIDEITFQSSATLSNDDKNAFKFKTYPNPVRDVLNINTLEPIQKVEVFDLLGKSVLTKYNVMERLDVSNLKSALYLVRLTSENGISTKKFIKK